METLGTFWSFFWNKNCFKKSVNLKIINFNELHILIVIQFGLVIPFLWIYSEKKQSKNLDHNTGIFFTRVLTLVFLKK